MTNPTVALVERRMSANRCDTMHVLAESAVEKPIHLATRAPTACHLQNRRFIAQRSPEAKMKLRRLAYGQEKVSGCPLAEVLKIL